MTLHRFFDRREIKRSRKRGGEPRPSLPGMVTDPNVATMLKLQEAVGAKRSKSKEFHEKFAFQIRAYKLPKPFQYLDAKGFLSYEFRYCNEADEIGVEAREFRADFAWPDFKLLVEIQGGLWQQQTIKCPRCSSPIRVAGGGGHSHPTGIERDITKHQYAALLGYFVMPITTDQVTSGHGIEWAQRILSQRGWIR